jgi:hypothetical protein
VTVSSGVDMCPDRLTGISPEVLLLDDCMGHGRCRSIIDEVKSNNESLKIIILTLDHPSPDPGLGETAVMPKYSGKKDFESRIRELFAPKNQLIPE